jgi:hypothetical protein
VPTIFADLLRRGARWRGTRQTRAAPIALSAVDRDA